MPEKVNLAYAFKLPPEEAVKYFRSKKLKGTENWWDIWQEQHARSFVVARAAKDGALKDIRGAMLKSLEQGTTERQFIKELEPRLRRRGWWGRRESDGKMLGSHRRLKTIYRTNSASSYNAGRYREQMRRSESRPYWQYVAVLDASTRDQHRALNGKVFPYDDEFWDYFYPPNGFNCRCRVRTLSERKLKREGLKVESSAGKLFKGTQEIGFDRETGEVIKKEVTGYRGRDIAGRKVAVKPHAGFDSNPAKEWHQWSPIPKQNVPPADFNKLGVPEELKLRPGVRRPAAVPNAPDVDKAHEAIISSVIPKGKRLVVLEPPSGEKVVIEKGMLRHMVDRRPDGIRDHRERYANYIVPTILAPDEEWYAAGVRRFIKLFPGEKDPEPMLLVLRQLADGKLLLYTGYRLRPKAINKQRGEVLIYSRWLAENDG